MYSIPSVEIFSLKAKTAASALFSLAFFALVLLATPLAARAQSATVFGSLSNFDVVNNTEHE